MIEERENTQNAPDPTTRLPHPRSSTGPTKLFEKQLLNRINRGTLLICQEQNPKDGIHFPEGGLEPTDLALERDCRMGCHPFYQR